MQISTPGCSEPGVKPPSNAESTLEFKPHSFSRVCITTGVFFGISEDDLEFVVIDLMIPGIRGQPGIWGIWCFITRTSKAMRCLVGHQIELITLRFSISHLLGGMPAVMTRSSTYVQQYIQQLQIYPWI